MNYWTGGFSLLETENDVLYTMIGRTQCAKTGNKQLTLPIPIEASFASSSSMISQLLPIVLLSGSPDDSARTASSTWAIFLGFYGDSPHRYFCCNVWTVGLTPPHDAALSED